MHRGSRGLKALASPSFTWAGTRAKERVGWTLKNGITVTLCQSMHTKGEKKKIKRISIENKGGDHLPSTGSISSIHFSLPSLSFFLTLYPTSPSLRPPIFSPSDQLIGRKDLSSPFTSLVSLLLSQTRVFFPVVRSTALLPSLLRHAPPLLHRHTRPSLCCGPQQSHSSESLEHLI